MINLLPTVDVKTREDLNEMLSNNPNTPRKVHEALKPEARRLPVQELELMPDAIRDANREAIETIDPVMGDPVMGDPVMGDPVMGHAAKLKENRFKRKFSIEKLRSSLPSQIPQIMANVVGLAARRNNRHTLRTVLSVNLRISRAYADHILNDSDGFPLAAALRSLRMPRDVARDVLMAGNGKISANPIDNPEAHLDQFDRLDPEACRKRVLDWNTAFNNRMAASKEDATHQPIFNRAGLEQHKPASLRERQAAVISGKKLA